MYLKAKDSNYDHQEAWQCLSPKVEGIVCHQTLHSQMQANHSQA